MSWRLIYKENKVIDLLESNGITYTQNNIFISDSLDECFSKIDELKLNTTYIVGDEKIIFSAGTRTTEDI